MLTVSNMQGVYRESFGTTRGDGIFVVLAALWSAKHLLWRWMSCWDPSTSRSPTVCGLMAHVATNYFMGGQVYDRPSPRQIAKFLNLRSTGGTTGDDSRAYPLLQTAQSSMDYAGKLWSHQSGNLVKRLYRWSQQSSSSSLLSSTLSSSTSTTPTSKPPRSKFGRFLATCRRQWEVLRQNAPSVQFLLYCTGLYAIKSMVRHKLRDLYRKETVETSLYSASLGVAMKQEQNMMQRKGDYQPRDLADSWWEDAWSVPVLVFVGFTMWVFGRLVPPIPDLVAGNHPLKDIRNDKTGITVAGNSNNSGSNSTTRGGGGSGGSGGGGGGGGGGNNSTTSRFWSTMATYGFASPTVHAWSETQAPISTVPRVYIHIIVGTLRMMDVLWVVLWLPRTDAVCQLTEHCGSAWNWKERTYYLNPIGVTTPVREGRPSRFWPSQVHGTGSFIIVAVNVLTLVPVLLWTQSLLTNRTYWATWGFCAKEWAYIGPWDGKGSHHPTWDARRKYKKNDVVLNNNKTFQATVAQPEGRPYDGFQRYMQNLLAGEVGNPAGSYILCRLAEFQLFNFFCQFLFWYNFHLHSVSTHGFLTALLANGFVTYIISKIGCIRPSAIAKLNAEVTGL